MIVRTLESIIGTDRDVEAETWRSRRMISAASSTRFSSSSS